VAADPGAAEANATDERRLAVGALQVLVALALPVVAIAGWLVGWDGALSALIGLAFVLVLFGGSAALLAFAAARTTPARGVGLLVVGAVARLPLYLVALRLLEQVPWIHGRSLAAATALAVAVTLAYEVHLLRRMPRLFWIDAAAVRPPAVANDTRSRAL
jgi:hypothetical protein